MAMIEESQHTAGGDRPVCEAGYLHALYTDTTTMITSHFRVSPQGVLDAIRAAFSRLFLQVRERGPSDSWNEASACQAVECGVTRMSELKQTID
jgi:hypothetical protein